MEDPQEHPGAISIGLNKAPFPQQGEGSWHPATMATEFPALPH